MSDLENYPVLNDPEMKEIVESFLMETKEILEKLDVDLIELEKRPEDLDLLNQIFRSFHTIKGTSGFLGLERLPLVTHKCEDILNKLRKGEAKLNTSIMDGIIDGFDVIKELLVKIEDEKNEAVDTDSVITSLAELLSKMEAGGEITAPFQNSLIESPVTAESETVEEFQQAEQVLTAVEIPKSAETKKESAKSQQSSDSKKTDNTIRVDVDRLDSLLDIVSELVLGRNRLAQVNSQFGIEYEGTNYSKDLADTTKHIDLMTTELQLVAMKLRMIKIAKVFNRFPRVVRDMTKELDKDVNLVIRGEDTEVDKNLIEEINDPLVHLVRNSVDHGIEMPADRVKKGKDPKGTVILSAEHEGNNIVITIEDDGKGIDPNILKEKAIEKGLITEEKAKELTKQEAYNLIFLPGFSTAQKVTNISGRGVGMDVVKTNVSRLRGTITVESEVGKGTKIILKLPLTLAIISGMIVRSYGESVVIPLHSVVEVFRVNKDQIRTIKGREVINLRDMVLPILNLEQLLRGGHNGHNDNGKGWHYVVEVGLAEKRFGIKVDELIGQQEVVIKSLGSYLGKINGVAGSTIMGDGSVVMILDLNELINKLDK